MPLQEQQQQPLQQQQQQQQQLPKVLFIIGPTGVGKSRLAFDLCMKLKDKGVQAEIVSADSMQVYKGCDIGTAKAAAAERAAIPHHLLDLCCPQEAFTAADFLAAAKRTVRDHWTGPLVKALSQAGKLPVVVGGTQLYVELLLWRSAVDVYSDSELNSKSQKAEKREIKTDKRQEEADCTARSSSSSSCSSSSSSCCSSSTKSSPAAAKTAPQPPLQQQQQQQLLLLLLLLLRS
ncbi:tRNA delta(2)-isopentenylpyrophosphate transferase, putative [Eimeria necatrix]|uniref:tRNA delta(2)-isopentenylpyrophosphate transferase, putative n=1 Tax=Eimeria necatrix TaxID=51315 RepID=U6N468_9EIME|nr:tRNA delta(2)-isopentenylpyrophosphate transferase, putative [Eimeria necatrix]CDJ70074.1 tRNA delta(2)-isopentenylpyrophosphate transferase, putative [Eimeria necatrix]